MDDSLFLVFGDGGVLQLCKLWDVDNDQGGIKWPDSEAEWAAYQDSNAEGQRLRRECVETGQEFQVGRDTMVVQGSSRLLYRRRESRGRTQWQLWVPEILRHSCMVIHHEGSAHPGLMEDAPDHQAEVSLASYEAGGESALCGVQGLCITEPVSSPANDPGAGVSRDHQANGTDTHRPHWGATSYGGQW